MAFIQSELASFTLLLVDKELALLVSHYLPRHVQAFSDVIIEREEDDHGPWLSDVREH